MYMNTFFVAYLYCVGIHHGNLIKPFVTISRVTYFIPQDHTGNCKIKVGSRLGEKTMVNGPAR